MDAAFEAYELSFDSYVKAYERGNFTDSEIQSLQNASEVTKLAYQQANKLWWTMVTADFPELSV